MTPKICMSGVSATNSEAGKVVGGPDSLDNLWHMSRDAYVVTREGIQYPQRNGKVGEIIIFKTSWWLNQPLWTICSSNWIISPGGENLQYSKPPSWKVVFERDPGYVIVPRKGIQLPSRERMYIPPLERWNHLQSCLLMGYVSFQEGILPKFQGPFHV